MVTLCRWAQGLAPQSAPPWEVAGRGSGVQVTCWWDHGSQGPARRSPGPLGQAGQDGLPRLSLHRLARYNMPCSVWDVLTLNVIHLMSEIHI